MALHEVRRRLNILGENEKTNEKTRSLGEVH